VRVFAQHPTEERAPQRTREEEQNRSDDEQGDEDQDGSGHAVNLPTDFFAAIDAGDVDRVEAFLRDDPALADGRDEARVSPVRHALYRGQRAAAERIAAVASSLDAFDLAALGDADGLRAFLAAHPDAATAYSEDGFTALHFAAFLGGADVARVLLDAGANVAAVANNTMKVQPLHSAAAGRPEVCAVLLDAGATVDARQSGGFTPLHEAALNGNEELVTRFLSHGADASATDDDGRTAADHAQRAGHTDLAARLSRV
jgi:ankyrin repeat protein